jgi:hypothetical protein
MRRHAFALPLFVITACSTPATPDGGGADATSDTGSMLDAIGDRGSMLDAHGDDIAT